MSLLNPVLLPPRVKAYLSQGERFIKWDDVSGAGALASGALGHGGRAARGLCRGGRIVLCLLGPRRLCGLARQLTPLPG